MASDQSESDFYTTLRIEPAASADAVRSAYLELARRHHPDLNQDRQAARRRFQEVVRAYEVLSDPVRRRQYDVQRKKIAKQTVEDRSVFCVNRPLTHVSGESHDNHFWPGWEQNRRRYPSGLAVVTPLVALAALSAGLTMWNEPETRTVTRLASRQHPPLPRETVEKPLDTPSVTKQSDTDQVNADSIDQPPDTMKSSRRRHEKVKAARPSPLIEMAESVSQGLNNDPTIVSVSFFDEQSISSDGTSSILPNADDGSPGRFQPMEDSQSWTANLTDEFELDQTRISPMTNRSSSMKIAESQAMDSGPRLPSVNVTSPDSTAFDELHRDLGIEDSLWLRDARPAVTFSADHRSPRTNEAWPRGADRVGKVDGAYSAPFSHHRSLPQNQWNRPGTIGGMRFPYRSLWHNMDANPRTWNGSATRPPAMSHPAVDRGARDDRAAFDPYPVLDGTGAYPSTGIESSDLPSPYGGEVIDW